MIFINDGVYGSFNCKFYDHVHPMGFPLLPALDEGQKKWATTIWGPTCDGLDQVEELTFMREVDVGEWLCYPNMGAYTSAAGSEFNGFPRPKSFYFIGQHCRDILRQAGDDRNSG